MLKMKVSFSDNITSRALGAAIVSVSPSTVSGRMLFSRATEAGINAKMGVGTFRSASGKLNAPVVERLGKQSIEGVEVEGTRSTVTIPAGQIGNEQPIRIVSERWYSPDLKVLVMSRQSDPRFGETTYRLTSIVRAEPAPELFEVPADFTVVEPGGAGAKGLRIERK